MRTGMRAAMTLALGIMLLIVAACDASPSPSVRKTPTATGLLYVATETGTVTALDASNGHARWSTNAGASARVVAADDALLYVAAANGTLLALRAGDGATVWQATVGAAAQVTVDGETLALLGAADGAADVYALDRASGTVRWRRAAAQDDTLATSDSYIYVAHNTQTPVDGPTDGFLTALRLGDGSEAWRFETGGETLGAPTVAYGGVYAPTSKGVFALDAASGARHWYTAAGTYNGVQALVNRAVCVTTTSAALGLSPQDGHEVWRATTTNEIVRTTMMGGILYLATFDRILALDDSSGAQRWDFTGAGPLSGPLATRGATYVTDGAGALHALDGAGHERWHVSGAGVPVAASDAALFAVRGGDALTALRAGDGAVQWRYQADGGPQLSAIVLS